MLFFSQYYDHSDSPLRKNISALTFSTKSAVYKYSITFKVQPYDKSITTKM